MKNEKKRGVEMNSGFNCDEGKGLGLSSALLVLMVVAVISLATQARAGSPCKPCEKPCAVINPENKSAEKYLNDPPCMTIDFDGNVEEGGGLLVPPDKCDFLPYLLAEFIGWDGEAKRGDEFCVYYEAGDPDLHTSFGGVYDEFHINGFYYMDEDGYRPKLYGYESDTEWGLVDTYDGTAWYFETSYMRVVDEVWEGTYFLCTDMGFVDGYIVGDVDVEWEDVDVTEEEGYMLDYYVLKNIIQDAYLGYFATIDSSGEPLEDGETPNLLELELRSPSIRLKRINGFNGVGSALGAEGTKASWETYRDTSWTGTSGTGAWELVEGKYFFRNEDDQVQYAMDLPAALRLYADEACFPDGITGTSGEIEAMFAKYATQEYEYDEVYGYVVEVTSSACCGGGGVVNHDYGESTSNGVSRNEWVKKRVDNFRLNDGAGDGKVETYWINSYDQIVHQRIELYVSDAVVETRDTHYDYRADGEIEKEYTPDSLDESGTTANANGTVTLDIESSTGLIRSNEYYSCSTGEGLSGKYTDNGELAFRVDDDVNINPSTSHPDGITGTSVCGVVWTGRLKPTQSGIYTFYLQHADLKIDGEAVSVTDDNGTDVSDPYTLEAYQYYDIELTYDKGAAHGAVMFEWSAEDEEEQVILSREDVPASKLFSLIQCRGLLKAEKIQVGSSGTPTNVVSYEYISGHSSVPIVTQVARAVDDDDTGEIEVSDAEVTRYAYPSGFETSPTDGGIYQPLEIVTQVYPQSYTGGGDVYVESKEYCIYSDHDLDRKFVKEPSGSVSCYVYYTTGSATLGKLKYRVLDIDTSSPPSGVSVSGIPAAYETTSGLNLTTAYTYDSASGEVSRIDHPDGTRTYIIVRKTTTSTGDGVVETSSSRWSYHVEYEFINNKHRYTLLEPVEITDHVAGAVNSVRKSTISSWAVGQYRESVTDSEVVPSSSDVEDEVLARTDTIYEDANGVTQPVKMATHVYHEYDGGEVDDTTYLETTYTYANGKLESVTNPEGGVTFYTKAYSAYDTGKYGTEQRVYTYDGTTYGLLGSVQVTWTDLEDRVVCRKTGTCSLSASDPDGDETLTILSRTDYEYDWRGRQVAEKRYYDVTNEYYYETQYEYDNLDRVWMAVRDVDSEGSDPGNIAITVRDLAGRPKEAWQGTDATDAAWDDPEGTGSNDMACVSQTFYDDDANRTGTDQRDYVTQTWSLKTNLAVTPDEDTSSHWIATRYSAPYNTETVGTEQWVRTAEPLDDDIPWTWEVLDDAGRAVQVLQYAHTGETKGDLLSKVTRGYDISGKLEWTRQYEISSGAATQNYLETSFEYDDAGRQNQVETPDGRIRKTEYNAASRVIRSWLCAGDDDTVVEEAEYTLDGLGNAVEIITYLRNHDDTSTATLLSNGWTDTEDAQVRFVGSWYDAAGRLTGRADYGDNGGSEPSWPSSVPAAGTASGPIVTTYEYDDAGYLETVTDNSGMETSYTYDSLGRKTAVIESGTSPAALDRYTIFEYNGAGQITRQAADIDGSETFNAGDQITVYTYGGDDGECPVARIDLLVGIEYPDGGEIECTYYADGSLKTKTDQRGVIITYEYDAAGRRALEKASTLPSLSEPLTIDDGVKRIDYSYDDLGRLLTATSYSDVGATTAVNEVENTYDTWGQLDTQEQDVDSVTGGTGATTQEIDYAYAAATQRPTSLEYPNGRTITYDYDSGSISDDMSRLAKIRDGGLSIAKYEYVGANRLVVKDYELADVKLDYWGDSTGTYEGLDKFGRIKSQHWVSYEDTPDRSLFDIEYTYDDASNRQYAERHQYPGQSQAYGYDALHRLTSFARGAATYDGGDMDGVSSYWLGREQGWDGNDDLDTVGNQWNIKDFGQDDWYDNEFNIANEFDDTQMNRAVLAAAKPYLIEDDFTVESTEDEYESIGTETVNVHTGDGGYLEFTDGSFTADTFSSYTEDDARAVAILGGELGPHQADLSVTLPGGGGYAGYVFGYQDANNYWMLVGNATSGDLELYQVEDGDKDTAVASASWPVMGTFTIPIAARSRYLEFIDYEFPDGFPGGKVGVVSTIPGIKFNELTLRDDADCADLLGRWRNPGDYAVIEHDTDEYSLNVHRDSMSGHRPIVLKNLRTDEFKAEFSLVKPLSGHREMDFVFNYKDQDNFNYVKIYWDTQAKVAPSGYAVVGGKATAVVSATTDTTKMHLLSDTDTLDVVVTYDGTDLDVYLRDSTESWFNDPCFSSDAFTCDGGMIGFADMGYPTSLPTDITGLAVDNLKVSLPDGVGGWEAPEIIEEFTLNSGYGEVKLLHDAAGNLVYDGQYKYSYDAWNRMTKVQRAYSDGASNDGDGDSSNTDPELGSVIATMSYDGLGRRNVKAVTNCSDWDATYHYYYDGQRMVEVHNGSQDVLKQYVWGPMYVDELVQIAINQDPEDASEDLCDRFFFALQDANYNVLGMVGVDFVPGTGVTMNSDLVERYEYTPYGQRTVYSHGHHIADYNLDGYLNMADGLKWMYEDDGQDEEASPADGDGDGDVDNDDYAIAYAFYTAGEWQTAYPDTKVMHPRLNSAQLEGGPTGGGLASLCDIGHQGLLYDREFGLYYNRARMYDPSTARFMQRDPMQYVDGMSLYEYERSGPANRLDSTGLFLIPRLPEMTWEIKGEGCNFTASAEGTLEMHSLVDFFADVNVSVTGKLSADWTNEDQSQCVSHFTPVQSKEESKRGYFPPYAWVKGSVWAPSASAEIFAKAELYYETWYDAGTYMEMSLSASASKKIWIQQCCKCLELKADYSGKGDVKQNQLGTGEVAAAVVAILATRGMIIPAALKLMEAARSIPNPFPVPVLPSP